MATGQKKGTMIALWVLRVVVGLAFLAAGGSKLAGAPAMVAMFAKIGFRAMVPYPNRLARGGRGHWPICASLHRLCGVDVGCCDGGAIGFHLTRLGGNPVPPTVLLLLAILIVLVGQEDFAVGSAVHLNPT